MSRIVLIVLLCAGWLGLLGQVVPHEKPPKPPFDRKEEIIYDGKRYRIHNSYLSLGPGYLQSSIRPTLQKMIGLDYVFYVRRLHFQAGVMMSGEGFGSNNNVQGHIGYGFRKEKAKSNIAAFAGPSFYTGVEADPAGNARFYQGVGLYGSAQIVTKFTYDIGLGLELFGDVSIKQSMVGLKLIAFFSGAYRGPKKNFNPHVKTENPG
jgi:hypothetical protein